MSNGMVVSYIRDEGGLPVACLVAKQVEAGSINVGWSKCCEKEPVVVKKRGRDIAMRRLEFKYQFNGLPFAIQEMMPIFQTRCEKYYKRPVVFGNIVLEPTADQPKAWWRRFAKKT